MRQHRQATCHPQRCDDCRFGRLVCCRDQTVLTGQKLIRESNQIQTTWPKQAPSLHTSNSDLGLRSGCTRKCCGCFFRVRPRNGDADTTHWSTKRARLFFPFRLHAEGTIYGQNTVIIVVTFAWDYIVFGNFGKSHPPGGKLS